MSKTRTAILASVGGSLGALFVLGAIIYTLRLRIKIDKEQIDRSFFGVIQKISYDEKSIPTVTINGKDYYLDAYDGDIIYNMHPDDSIVKMKGSFNYILYRKDTHGKWQLIHSDR